MSETISISVPNHPELLRLAGEFLSDCASVAPTSDEVESLGGDPESRKIIETMSAGRESIPPSNAFAENEEESTPKVTSGQLDAEGRPWDERIDSSGRTFMSRGNTLTGKGCWKPKNKPKELSQEAWEAFHAATKLELAGGPRASTAVLADATPAVPVTPAPLAPVTPAPAVSLDGDSLRDRVIHLCSVESVGTGGAMKVLSEAGITGGVPNIVHHPDKFEMLDAMLTMHGV